MQKLSRVDAYLQETACSLKLKVAAQLEEWGHDVEVFQEEVRGVRLRVRA